MRYVNVGPHACRPTWHHVMKAYKNILVFHVIKWMWAYIVVGLHDVTSWSSAKMQIFSVMMCHVTSRDTSAKITWKNFHWCMNGQAGKLTVWHALVMCMPTCTIACYVKMNDKKHSNFKNTLKFYRCMLCAQCIENMWKNAIAIVFFQFVMHFSTKHAFFLPASELCRMS